MEELVKTATERGGEWADKVAIVPLSIDDSSEIVARHVKDRAWDKLPHFWSPAGERQTEFSSEAADAFGVHAVPTAYLIGRDGRILWTGSPMASLFGKKPADRIAAALRE
jgi:hypothetical protein